MTDRPDTPSPRSVVVICTRNRPEDLARALAAIDGGTVRPPVLVADASDEDRKPAVRSLVADRPDTVLLDCTPGLARQRNQALDRLLTQDPPPEVVHFIDDDTVVEPEYFAQIGATFAARPDLAGVGGVVLNQARPRQIRAKSLFALYSARPGIVLRSGRNTIGHYPGSEAPRPDWLPGCCMSYRLAKIGDLRFDGRLTGYSWGEDLYFSYALSRRHPLAIAPDARVVHLESQANRMSAAAVARVRIPLLHRFVREHRADGLRTGLFWLSVVGEVALRLADGLIRRDRASVSEASAIARAGLRVLVRPLGSYAATDPTR